MFLTLSPPDGLLGQRSSQDTGEKFANMRVADKLSILSNFLKSHPPSSGLASLLSTFRSQQLQPEQQEAQQYPPLLEQQKRQSRIPVSRSGSGLPWKRGPTSCINSCLNGGSMSFVRCKSMCHWWDGPAVSSLLSACLPIGVSMPLVDFSSLYQWLSSLACHFRWRLGSC